MLPAPVSSSSSRRRAPTGYGYSYVYAQEKSRPHEGTPLSSFAANNSQRSPLLDLLGISPLAWTRLRQRSRITNLGLFALTFAASLSFLFNIALYFAPSNREYGWSSPPSRVLDTLPWHANANDTQGMAEIDHLVIVPGHSIWTGEDAEAIWDEEHWMLADYQSGGGRTKAFVEHIKRGAELTMSDPRALLIFSGGQTHADSTTTEGESYLRLALAAGFLPPFSDSFYALPPSEASPSPSAPSSITDRISSPATTPPPHAKPTALSNTNLDTPPSQPHAPPTHPHPTSRIRATTENYALDSYQNLLFSIARFRETTGRFPRRVTVVGYAMKAKRFAELHRAAVRWPAERFAYVGVDLDDSEAPAAREGEYYNGYVPYTRDTYGCHGYLRAKRLSRNPHARFHPYHASAPELRGLLEWCPTPGAPDHYARGMTDVYRGPLPWDYAY